MVENTSKNNDQPFFESEGKDINGEESNNAQSDNNKPAESTKRKFLIFDE